MHEGECTNIFEIKIIDTHVYVPLISVGYCVVQPYVRCDKEIMLFFGHLRTETTYIKPDSMSVRLPSCFSSDLDETWMWVEVDE